MRVVTHLLAALLVVLAGCAAEVEVPVDPTTTATEEPTTDSPTETEEGGKWAALSEATIRPGVSMSSKGGQCTSNFVFTSPDNRSVYLGFAAHCVGEGTNPSNTDGCDKAGNPSLPMGTKVTIEGATKPGMLAYSSWAAMQAANETNALACAYNDFAVVELDPADRNLVNPAMLKFGGPTGVADITKVQQGDKVITYGNSGLRQGIEALSPHEGYVVDTSGDGWSTQLYTATPGVPGDSGSGVMLGDGQALGALVTVSIAPMPLSNNVSTLSMLLAYAESHGLPMRLATAPILDAGVLPG